MDLVCIPMEIHDLIPECGVSVIYVLKGATPLTADRFGFHDRGRVEVGRKADLVLVEGDVRQLFGDESELCLPARGV